MKLNAKDRLVAANASVPVKSKFQLNAAARLKQEAAGGWWEALTPEQQAEFVAENPDSPQAQQLKAQGNDKAVKDDQAPQAPGAKPPPSPKGPANPAPGNAAAPAPKEAPPAKDDAAKDAPPADKKDAPPSGDAPPAGDAPAADAPPTPAPGAPVAPVAPATAPPAPPVADPATPPGTPEAPPAADPAAPADPTAPGTPASPAAPVQPGEGVPNDSLVPGQPATPAAPQTEQTIRLLQRMGEKLKHLSPKDQQFYTTGGIQPNSAQRTKLGSFVRARSGEIVQQLVGQGPEWQASVAAIKKMCAGQPLDPNDKYAVRETAQDLSIIVGGLALGGGLGHALPIAIKHIGIHALQESALKSVAKSLLQASVSQALAADADDEEEEEDIPVDEEVDDTKEAPPAPEGGEQPNTAPNGAPAMAPAAPAPAAPADAPAVAPEAESDTTVPDETTDAVDPSVDEDAEGVPQGDPAADSNAVVKTPDPVTPVGQQTVDPTVDQGGSDQPEAPADNPNGEPSPNFPGDGVPEVPKLAPRDPAFTETPAVDPTTQGPIPAVPPAQPPAVSPTGVPLEQVPNGPVTAPPENAVQPGIPQNVPQGQTQTPTDPNTLQAPAGTPPLDPVAPAVPPAPQALSPVGEQPVPGADGQPSPVDPANPAGGVTPVDQQDQQALDQQVAPADPAMVTNLGNTDDQDFLTGVVDEYANFVQKGDIPDSVWEQTAMDMVAQGERDDARIEASVRKFRSSALAGMFKQMNKRRKAVGKKK